MVQNLQVSSELWNRNIDLLNILTYGDLTAIAGDQRGSLRQVHSACFVILRTIGPLYYDVEQRDVTTKSGEVIHVNRTIRGIETTRFKNRWNKLNMVKRFMLASENPGVGRWGKFQAAQRAYELLQELGLELAQDIEDLGLNKKEKTPGSAAALTGT